jgi:hypothetical protein
VKSNELGIDGTWRRIFSWANLACGIVCSVTAVISFAARALAVQRDLIFPASEGTTWSYTGHAKWTPVGGNGIRSGNLQWTTQTLKTLSAPGMTAAVIKGFPFELAWYSPETKPGFTVLVENGNGLFKADVESEAEGEALAAKAILGQEVGEQLLKFPVHVGDCLPAEGTDSPELVSAHMYCWFVSKEVKDAKGRGWEVVQQTGPDDMTFRIVPGIGITSFVYHHHGTVAIANARLVAFHPTKKR